MNTDTLVHRPPYDMSCPVIQVTRGCSHGKCRFCDIQEGKAFEPVPSAAISIVTSPSPVRPFASL